MPCYNYRCAVGHDFTRWLPLAQHRRWMPCHCGVLAEQVITAPLLVKAAPDVCYDSPIDGRPITSWEARQEDLKRHNCRPYDPEMKTDYHMRCKASDTALDQAIEATVEQEIMQMSTAQRGRLASDLLDQSADIIPVRGTVT